MGESERKKKEQFNISTYLAKELILNQSWRCISFMLSWDTQYPALVVYISILLLLYIHILLYIVIMIIIIIIIIIYVWALHFSPVNYFSENVKFNYINFF